MPSALVLEAGGEIAGVTVPASMNELHRWTHEYYFPRGVVLHRGTPLCAQTVARVFGGTHQQGQVQVMLLLMRDSQDTSRMCNYHEIPKMLDSQLFFGHLLVVLAMGEIAVSSLSINQYQSILTSEQSTTPLTRWLAPPPSLSPPSKKKKRAPAKKVATKKRLASSMEDHSSGDEVMAMITSTTRTYDDDQGSFEAESMGYGDD